MRKKVVSIVIFAVTLVILGGIAAAQDTGDCPTLVNRALTYVGNNCVNMGRDTVCYGHQDIEAAFLDETTLSNPADRAELLHLVSLESMPFDLEEEVWGIALLNLQANLPNTLPGQAVKLILLGDTYIENAVSPDSALLYLDEALDARVQADMTGIFALPTDFGVSELSIVGHFSAGEIVQADGLSPTGEWVRVTYPFTTDYGQSATAWVKRADLIEDEALDTLPVIGPDSYTPMQAYYFTTGVGQAQCNELPPSSILVQGPETYEVTIRPNGADINITSTILLETFANFTQMRLTVLSGFARVNPNSPEELIIPTGYSATICLDGTFDLGLANDENDYTVGEDCDWVLGQGMTPAFFALAQALAQIPGHLLNYGITVPQQVCASGVGGVVCEYRYSNPAYAERLQKLCDDGFLPESVCQFLGNT